MQNLELKDFPEHIQKSFIDNELEKGVYKDTPQNRKLGRVGATYGDKKKEEHETQNDKKSNKESSSISSMKESLVNHFMDKAAKLDKKAKETGSLKYMNHYLTLANNARREAKKFARGEHSDKRIKNEYDDLKELGRIK